MKAFSRWTILKTAPQIYRVYMALVSLTSVRVYIGFDELWKRLKGGQKAVVALLHQSILLAPYIYRDGGVMALASRSRDGELIASTMEALGFIVVRGSTSKGGAEALRRMVRLLKEDEIRAAAITVDGPRGPAGKVKPGVVFLARKSGLPIYPIGCRARRKVLLNSWDRTLIPLPFNTIEYRCGTPFPPDRGGIDEVCRNLEGQLKELQGWP